MNLLEFNDAELSLYRDGQPIYAQPGIAHVATAGNLFGFEALRIARLHPQAANQQYLARLNADPLPVPGKLAANHADLVYQHLLALKACLGNAAPAAVQVGSAASPSSAMDNSRRKRWNIGLRRKADGADSPQAACAGKPLSSQAARAPARTGVAAAGEATAAALTAAVPGSLGTDQLGVLLGIAHEAGIDIQGFVDSAVLMASAFAVPAHCWLLDLHLTRACLTELHAGDEVEQVSTQELPGCGLMSCMDGWANLVGDRFVQDTRFDPLHAADTEQQLYDQLYGWALSGWRGAAAGVSMRGITPTHSAVKGADPTVEIRHGGHERRVQVSAASLRGKLMQRFQQLTRKLPTGARLLVAPRSAALPGLLPGLAELGIQAEGLAADALVQGFSRHAARIASGALTLVSRLPCGGLKPEPVADERSQATHVLFENRAWPLAGNPFGLSANGCVGDTIAKDGKSFRLIAVAPGSRQMPER